MKSTVNVLLLFFLLGLLSGAVVAGEGVRVAVASNFSSTMQRLIPPFELQSGYRVTTSYASSGKLFAQITHGAPFDIFLSADGERPHRLELLGLVAVNQRFTYATGNLLLWAPDASSPEDALQQLQQGRFSFLSIANPKIAPYGAAAMQVMAKLGLGQRFIKRTARGENIAQTYQFVYSGNAQLGFVAKSQMVDAGGDLSGGVWAVPSHMHSPIEQQGVLLKRAEQNPAAHAFIDYLRSDSAKQIIAASGYGSFGGLTQTITVE